LVWLTVDKATLKNHRNAYEYRVLVQLAEGDPALPGVEQQTAASRMRSRGLRAVVRRTQTQVQRGPMQDVPGLARNET
jgi:hypothetical protein